LTRMIRRRSMAIARSPEDPAGRKAGFGRRGPGANLVCGSYPWVYAVSPWDAGATCDTS